MTPPSAIETPLAQPPNSINAEGHKQIAAPSVQENGEANPVWSAMKGTTMGIPKFQDKYQEREYQKGRLALAFRIFAQHGFDKGIAGHITLRDPVEPTSFWVNPFGVPWKRLRASDLIRIDHAGNIVDGGEVRLLNAAAYAIHHAVHTARPDVNCVAHSHSVYGQAFCTLGRELDMTTIDACSFYKDHVVYSQFNGVVLADEEGIHIAKALGQKKAALLLNHGLLTCGETIEAAVHWYLHLDNCCRVQLLADAAAGGRGHETIKVTEEDAVETYKVNGTPFSGWFSARPLFETMAYESGEDYTQ